MHAFGQMRSVFDQCRTPKFKPAAVDELRSAFGHWCKGNAQAGCDTQLRGTDATHCMVIVIGGAGKSPVINRKPIEICLTVHGKFHSKL